MGSIRSCRKEEKVKVDHDFISFFASFFIHCIIIFTLACLYDNVDTVKKISLSLNFDDISHTNVIMDHYEDSIVIENPPIENIEYTQQPVNNPEEISQIRVEEFVPENNNKDIFSTKDLLESIKVEHNAEIVSNSSTENINDGSINNVINDLTKVTEKGISFNRSQPNPFAHLNGSGSSIETRLKSAGAQTGEIQISISWDTKDDIDLHVSYSPGNGLVDNINWVNKIGHISGGMLDIDMNANANLLVSNPVENVYWPHNSKLSGYYVVSVHYFRSWTGATKIPVIIRVKIKEKIQTFNVLAIIHSSPQRVTEFQY